METYVSINRLLNRSLRTLNELAVEVGKSTLEDRKSAIAQIAVAIDEVENVRETVCAQEPDLDYHYDNNRAPTKFMLEIAAFVQESHALEQAGKVDMAIKKLEDARALEPPALTHEMLTKRIEQLKAQDIRK
jgi:hypothetical protein